MPTYERKTIDLLISDDLRNILTEIESESVVAKLLLKKRHSKEDLVDSPVNYISVSNDDKTKISYLTEDRIRTLDSDTYWTSNSRYKGKPGAFVSKIFKNITPKEVEKFAGLFKTQSLVPKFTFKVIEGDEIKKYYHYSSYSEDGRGSLGVSCMKHDSCQKVLKLYTKNVNQLKMLIMLDEYEMLIGRALLWNLDNNKIMDRIYTKSDEELSFHFKKWATKNDYLYKSEQNWNNTFFFENLNIKRKELYIEFNLDINPKKYPYMDTFKFVNIESGRLFNYIPENIDVVTLTHCDGHYHEGDHLRLDGIDKVFRYKNEVRWLSYLNIYRASIYCNRYSNINDTYILDEHSKFDDDLGDYIFNGEYQHLNSARIEEIKRIKESRVHPTSRPSHHHYYDYSRIVGVDEDPVLIEQLDVEDSDLVNESIVEPINSLRDLITDLNNDMNDSDFTETGENLYRQWIGLSRDEQVQVLEDVTQQIISNNQSENLQLEEVPTPF